MNSRAIWIIIVVVIVVGIGIVLFSSDQNTDDEVNGENSENSENSENGEELTLVEEELEKLPREIMVRGRTVNLDRDFVEQEERDEYARLPYEVDLGDETRLVEAEIIPESGETPVEFAERFIEQTMPKEEELKAVDSEMYQYTASFYEMSKEELAEYPATDDGTSDETAEEGVSVYVRGMNFPDDSVGGSESRFDFIVTDRNAWVLVWYGKRNLCRRYDEGDWTPADQLCP